MGPGVVIDQLGGTIEGASGSPIEGVLVTVPAGAVTTATTFSLGYNVGGSYQNRKGAVPSPYVLVINSNGQHQFAKPLSVTFPYANPTNIAVPFYLSPEGTFTLLAALPIDRVNGRAGFLTWHASPFMWVDAPAMSSQGRSSTGFSPPNDGFQFSNATLEPDFAPEGRCVGISHFARWYKETYGGGLFGKFHAMVPKDAAGKKLTGEEVLATRAHNSVQRASLAMEIPTLSTRETLVHIMNGISMGRNQVIGISKQILIMEKGKNLLDFIGNHAMLAFAYTENQIGVYDSNKPGKWMAIDYQMNPGAADATVQYGDQDSLNVFGDVNPLESFTAILKDATAGFHEQSQSKIEITSHANGATVSEDTVTIKGNVHSGQVLIDDADVWVEYEDKTQSERKTFEVSESKKDFSVDLPLHPGANRIWFETRGQVVIPPKSVVKVIKNDLQKEEAKFVLNCNKAFKGNFVVSGNFMADWTAVGDAKLTPVRDGEYAISGTVTIDQESYSGITVLERQKTFSGTAMVHNATSPPTMYWNLPMLIWSGTTNGATINSFLILNWSSGCSDNWAPLYVDAANPSSGYPKRLKGTFTYPCNAIAGTRSNTVTWDFPVGE
jgi:hypothetical protein